MTSSLSKNPKLPKSCVGLWDSFVGILVIFAVFFGIRFMPEFNTTEFCMALIGGVSVVLGLIEIARAGWHKKPPSHEPFADILHRAAVKYLGLVVSMGVVGILYWAFPEYKRDFYRHYFEALNLVIPFFLPLSAAYLIYAEWRFPTNNDGLWQAGIFMLGRWKEIDGYKFHQNLMGWLVKGFFLAAMFSDLAIGVPRFRLADWHLWNLPFMDGYNLLFIATVTLELVFVTAGYFWSCRLFNTQLRTAEDTLYGWFPTIICYGPFLQLTFSRYFDYHGETGWQSWLSPYPAVAIIWGSVILLFMIIHMWCDACFGLHFSNLTNRGIVTNGCYRFCKHPAYFIKNLRWWMVSVPFIGAGGWTETLRLSLLLFAVNLVYFWRCAAEERLLSRDSTYVAYGLWMDEHGWFRWFGNILPSLTYANRLKKWRAQGVIKPMPTHYD